MALHVLHCWSHALSLTIKHLFHSVGWCESAFELAETIYTVICDCDEWADYLIEHREGGFIAMIQPVETRWNTTVEMMEALTL